MNQHNDDSNPGVTIRELAGAMGVAYQTVQRWIDPGGMPVMRWEIVSGRRFARLDMDRCVKWAAANRPALSGAGRGGWRPGSGRTKKDGTKRERPCAVERAGSASKVPKQPINQRRQGDAPAWAGCLTNEEYVGVMIAAVVARTRLKELKYQETRSRLLDRAEAEHWWQRLLQRFTERFAALPMEAADAFASQMGTDPSLRPKIAAIIEKEIAEALAMLEPTPFAALSCQSSESASPRTRR